MRGLNFILGLTVGMLVGAAGALLLAPASGEETKRNIHALTEQVRHKAEELREKGRHYIEDERSAVHEAVEAGRQAAQQRRAELEHEMTAAST
jgi:gas vesicle protein